VHVSNRIWEIFGKPGVRLATSYYSDGGDEHDSITRRRGSYDRTKANIVEVVNRSIPLRVGLIDVRDGQHVEQARLELARLGVSDVTVDRLRRVGRGARDGERDAAQLCGACAQGVVAISPTGEVWPCVFARWMPIGNVRQERLASILTGPAMRDAKARVADGIEMNKRKKCRPESTCDPQCPPSSQRCRPQCAPSNRPRCDPLCCPNNMCDPQCSPSCSPSCRPQGNCIPTGNCAPHY
jgi:MoaA/NifB/PqqE/SkfB family radical SAM enzyme